VTSVSRRCAPTLYASLAHRLESCACGATCSATHLMWMPDSAQPATLVMRESDGGKIVKCPSCAPGKVV
jgi:hypothetical protein